MNLVQLTRTQHSHLRIDPKKAMAPAASVHLVPLVRSEIRKMAGQFPVFFVKDGETGQFYPAALLGLEPHENLFWTAGALEAHHVPLNLLRLPFFVGGEQGMICIDAESPGLDGGPCAILEADGRDSAYMTQIQAILGELVGGRAATRDLVDVAVAQKLVCEVKLDLKFHTGGTAALSGLYSIDEKAFGRALSQLPDVDTVMILAAMALSLDHVSKLVERKNARLAAEAEWLQASA